MIAEKCEAVFGRPIMLQVNGIDHLYGVDESHPNHKDDRCGGLITWAQRFAAKKWPFSSHPDVVAATGLLKPKMVRIGDG
jgi:hypothetical protein